MRIRFVVSRGGVAAVSVCGRGDRDGDREAVTAERRHQAIENTFDPPRPDN
jgi:hypothetical protein